MRDYLEELVELFLEEDGQSDAPMEDDSVWDSTWGVGRQQRSVEERSASREDADLILGEEESVEAVSAVNKQELWDRLRNGTDVLARSDGAAVRQKGAPDGNLEPDRVSPGPEMEQTSLVLRYSLERAEQASRYRAVSRQEGRAASFLPTALQKDGVAGSAGIEARQVDRVFERDARRYDNRFTLF